ncbi:MULTISPECIES: hypothetical protein [Anoxybacillaceae]|uniref:Uncharacterized protein n=1 Tax=Parageobacillus toebii TaxID=153151 RepID=A0A150N5P1_9BACL|nr:MULTISPECIES: hypothetical protein [Bacillaceae]OQP02410.1 hypothetical protein B1689_01750 [Geobacillus sp. 44C]KYD32013.1 hypothetical protein B4110_0485 [Parageobacillus toebii]QNU36110.1 hypothetical protein IC802_10560 [Geobacillus sp. 44C]QSB48862.1 hypothetical protein JTI59_00295 [Parageobacillus toebii]WMT20443.1 hypothetical protein RFB12_08040 [Parageobacillus toebii]
MGWIILIGGLLLLGGIIDFIAKKRNMKIDPEEGAKNASDSERIYVETYMHNTKQNHENNPFL